MKASTRKAKGAGKPGGKSRGKSRTKSRVALRVAVQYAALPYRWSGGLLILLVTSRDTRRWVIPKGWPMKGRQPHAAAALEALEEAGVSGRIARLPVGAYPYVKRLKSGAGVNCQDDVYPLEVQRQRTRWREQHERTVHWFAPDDAAEAVHEPELAALIVQFAERTVRLRRQGSKLLPLKRPLVSAGFRSRRNPDRGRRWRAPVRQSGRPGRRR
jgi:8-oxo-dGTP pyrophosphatase MutT (NUDIX family)